MRAWALIAIGLVVALVVVLAPPLVQLQKDLTATRAKNAELESVVVNLKTELNAANQARTELQGSLEEAKSEIEKRQSEVERLSAELQKAIDLAKDAAAPNQQGEFCCGALRRLAAAVKSRMRNEVEHQFVFPVFRIAATTLQKSSRLVRPGATSSPVQGIMTVPGRPYGTSRHRSRYRHSQSRLVPPRWLGSVLPPVLHSDVGAPGRWALLNHFRRSVILLVSC